MNQDDKLMKKIASGDEKAFNELFHKYGGIILGYCGKYLNKTEAEEVSQEVWMKVIKASQSYQPEGKCLNWLYTIARNLCFSKYDNRHDLPLNETIFMTDTSDNADVEIEKEEELKGLLEKVDKLSLSQKTCVMMFYIEEKSIEEIAQYLKLTVSAVKVQLFRARNALRKEFPHGQESITK